MRAVEFDGRSVTLVQRPDPVPGPGQVVVRVAGAGLCHSDLTLMGRDPGEHPFKLPLVLGHEVTGEVAAAGAGVSGVSAGEPVAVYGPRGCRECRICARGEENHCPHARAAGLFAPGLGVDGGLAEYVLVDCRQLVALDGLDPVLAAPLTDAGVTALHALRPSLDLLGPGSTVVVVGVGGLGHVAVQIVRALTDARVVAIDRSVSARALATRLGAEVVLASVAEAADVLPEVTWGVGVDAILDFVASPDSLSMAAVAVRRGGHITIVGLGSGVLPVAVHRIPLGAAVRTPFWGTRADLVDILALARSGRIAIEVETFGLDDVPAAYERLRRGEISGRAVVRPGSIRTVPPSSW